MTFKITIFFLKENITKSKTNINTSIIYQQIKRLLSLDYNIMESSLPLSVNLV